MISTKAGLHPQGYMDAFLIAAVLWLILLLGGWLLVGRSLSRTTAGSRGHEAGNEPPATASTDGPHHS